MAVCALSKAFRRLNILRKGIIDVHYSTQQTELSVNATPIFWKIKNCSNEVSKDHVTFTPRSVNLNFNIPPVRLPLSKIIECPIQPNFQIDEPIINNIQKGDLIPNKVIDIPSTTNIIEKQAARLIVIRRKKMKKHKRRKWLKKMKFVLRKREQRKVQLKEKLFQAELQGVIDKAEKFDPKKYVAERIHLWTRKRLPNKWRGELLPEAMIIQFMKEKEEKKAHILRLKTYRLKLD